MDYVVARMQAAGHTHTYNGAATAAVPPPVPHHQLESIAIADADHRPPPVSQRTRGSALLQRQRREALEQEVSELKQQLSNEQTVHHILERAQQQQQQQPMAALVTNIPAFIPTKAKELLAELLLVEEEIARLEDQIQRMKQGGRRGGGGNSGAIVSAAMQQVPAPPPPDASSSCCCCNPNSNARSPRPSAAEHCKSMFFISQAMDGEAYLSKVNLNPNPNPNPKDDDYSRRPAAMKSPKNNILPPRHSLSLDNKQPQPQSSSSLSADGNSKINNNNKLSERIVKCLVCIFMRLLRSSRASELEKSGNLAAAKSGGSFRMEARDKDRGQQDHYGIFGIQDAIVRDVGPYKNLVRFTADLHLLSISISRGSPLVSKLREMLEALQQVDVRSLNHQQRLAFWINIYNTCIMHGILQHGLPSNSDKLLALKNRSTINVSGQTFNALVIENFILRQPSSVKQEFWKCEVDVDEQTVREVYGLKTSEPNILFALCCGIRSSPALRIYKADRVVMDLEKAKLEYLQAALVVTSMKRLMIPSLVHSNMHDFAKDMESLLRWICEQLPTSWSLRKSTVDCLSSSSRSHNNNHSNVNSSVVEEVVDVIPLDYEFQYLLPM